MIKFQCLCLDLCLCGDCLLGFVLHLSCDGLGLGLGRDLFLYPDLSTTVSGVGIVVGIVARLVTGLGETGKGRLGKVTRVYFSFKAYFSLVTTFHSLSGG